MKANWIKLGFALIFSVNALSCQEQFTVQNKPTCESLAIDKNIVGNWNYVSYATFQGGTKFIGKIGFQTDGVVTDLDSLFGVSIEGTQIDTKTYFIKGDTLNINARAKTRSILYKYVLKSMSCTQLNLTYVYNSQITLQLKR